MSVFRCSRCEQYIDGDYDGCHEDPHIKYGCMCDSCEKSLQDSYCISECYQDFQAIGFETQYNPHMGCG